MGLAPVLNALPIVRIAEVVAVPRFAQPTLLSDSLAGPLALRFRAKLLVSSVAVIGDKQLVTVQALAAMRFGLHQIKAASLKGTALGLQAGRKVAAEEDGKRREEDDLELNGEEDGTGRRPHFQAARFTAFSACR
jgi:hypothetical protein